MSSDFGLIRPHGGKLIDRFATGTLAAELAREADTLPALPVDEDGLLDALLIADGGMSPLEGFLGPDDLAGVRDHLRLTDGTLWPLPILLPVSPELALEIRHEKRVALVRAATGERFGVLENRACFDVDLARLAGLVFQTQDSEHPGVARLFARGATALAGPIQLFARPAHAAAQRYAKTPREVRADIAAAGFRSIAAFQTRNLAHRAHEHLQKLALAMTEGLLIHPLIGWLKPGDMLPETVMQGYELLRERYFAKTRTLLAGFATAMRYAGPREAVFHALVRKNFGCTHFIIGRDHAGVGGWYATYAAHELIRSLDREDLGITPLLFHGPRYCRRCEEVISETICPHGPEWVLEISGTEVRAMIARGERPPKEIMRPEIADFLIARQAQGIAFQPAPEASR